MKGAVVLDCRYCGRSLMYLGSRNDWHFYQCAGCGLIMLPADGRIRRSQESNSKGVKRRKKTARDEVAK